MDALSWYRVRSLVRVNWIGGVREGEEYVTNIVVCVCVCVCVILWFGSLAYCDKAGVHGLILDQ